LSFVFKGLNNTDDGWLFAQIGQGVVNYDLILRELVIPIPEKKLTLTTKPALINRMMVVCMNGHFNMLACGWN
jgi:hypothetical protein